MDRRRFISAIAGGVVVGPTAAIAQQSSMPVIGFINSVSPERAAYLVDAFRKGLREAGYVDGQNVAIEYRWVEGRNERFPAIAAEMARRPVALIAVGGGSAARLAAKAATATIPVLFFSGGDPVKEGLVASLSRPGGNVTGVVVPTTALDAKRLELLNQVVPSTVVVAVLVNQANFALQTQFEKQLKDIQAAARSMGRTIQVLYAGSEREIDAAFANLAQLHAGALLVSADPFFNSRRQQVVALTVQYRVPAIFEWREFATEGGLMSYGSSVTNGYREMGVYAGRILKGAKPSELPILQADKFELVINLKTAKELGLTIPQSLRLRADEVIQ